MSKYHENTLMTILKKFTGIKINLITMAFNTVDVIHNTK